MESNRFDAMTKLLALGTTRRFLPGLGGLALLATSGLDAEGKKKKKKKKKKQCKTTNQNCSSSAECCSGAICGVGSFQFEVGQECESVDGDVCCLTAGKSCSNLCDCCGSASICGDDNKCCVVNLGVCSQHSDCCGDNFCVDNGSDKTCRSNNYGAACDNNDDCLGGLFCVDQGEILGVICSCSSIGNPCDVDQDGDDECCPGSVCGSGNFCVAT